jgi:hypothetical protein
MQGDAVFCQDGATVGGVVFARAVQLRENVFFKVVQDGALGEGNMCLLAIEAHLVQRKIVQGHVYIAKTATFFFMHFKLSQK